MLKRTPLYNSHVSLGARMVDFVGWEMPVQYTGPTPEHMAVRQAAGLLGRVQVSTHPKDRVFHPAPLAWALIDLACRREFEAMKDPEPSPIVQRRGQQE